jgi:phosphate transport system protein
MDQVHQSAFDRDFGEITGELHRLCEMVEHAIARSMQALEENDNKLAKQIIEEDAQINILRYHIEEDCLALIATKQPAARDLRQVIGVMNIVVELERIGDYAAGTAKTVLRMRHEPLLKTFKKIFKMGNLSQQMLSDSLQAFLDQDVERARQIAGMDPEMDQLYKDVFDRLVEVMAKDPDLVTRAIYLMWIAHNLERIADRVTNIAERTIFVTTGEMTELE